MRKFLLLFYITSLFAFDNSQIDTKIIFKKHNIATVNKVITKGMTGYVIHNKMMIAKAVSMGEQNITLMPLYSLKNSALASPKISPALGDKVIFGLYNSRGLIIAPNQTIYLKTQQQNPNINFLSSDIFANYFDSKPTKKDFQKFCIDFNVGLIYFILDKQYVVDCNSFSVLETSNANTAKYTKPFFANYKEFHKSLFSSVPKNWIQYYKSLFNKSKDK